MILKDFKLPIHSGISPIKSAEITGSLRGRSNIISRIRELMENANKEVLICTSAPDFEDKSRVFVPTLEKLNKRNIKVKVALSGDAEKVRKLNAKFNLKARPLDSKARFFISDKREVLFMVTPENSEEEMGVWLQSPFFTESLSNMLESNLKNGNGHFANGKSDK